MWLYRYDDSGRIKFVYSKIKQKRNTIMMQSLLESPVAETWINTTQHGVNPSSIHGNAKFEALLLVNYWRCHGLNRD